MSDTSFQDKDWLRLREQYLKQVEEALAESDPSSVETIINDVRGHLDRKFAELPPLMRTWENFQKIITEMGPPSDYSELAGGKREVPGKRISVRFIVILAIFLTLLTGGLIMLPILLPKSPVPTWTDKIKSAFISEPALVGKWVSVDFVKDANEFNPDKKQWRGDLFLKDTEFRPDGTTTLGCFWTKGWIIDDESDIKAEYEIRDINGTTYLFLPWLSGDVTIRHQKPKYYVLKKVSETTPQQQAEDEQAKKAAIEAAKSWLELVDESRYEQSWIEAAEFFRKNVSQEQWVNALTGVRKPLGKAISREVITSTYTTEVPGAPDGQYVIIQFKTSFENKQKAVETVTPMLEPNGRWRVSGYYIK
ncbi:MAG: DUF4019 domain-containing protein [Sedimentisphaerales bacterium]|nr:DUF4019 domain-containing protein [Sedimentisphaerales bacterium]